MIGELKDLQRLVAQELMPGQTTRHYAFGVAPSLRHLFGNKLFGLNGGPSPHLRRLVTLNLQPESVAFCRSRSVASASTASALRWDPMNVALDPACRIPGDSPIGAILVQFALRIVIFQVQVGDPSKETFFDQLRWLIILCSWR